MPVPRIRKELRVRPGFVPSEDVAKYKVGGGSIRSQHLAAQANFQAPPSPSPAIREETPRRPNPSDFVPRDKPQYPAASPSKPSRGGASSSRWASAPAEPEPVPAVEKPAVLKPVRGRAGRQRGGGRGGKSPAMPSTDLFAASQAEEHDSHSLVEAESVTSEVLPAVPGTSTAAPEVPEKDPLSLSMDWPDDNPNGEWWQDDPEDLDVDAAAQALQGVSISDKSAPSSAAPSLSQPGTRSDRRNERSPASPPKPSRNERRQDKEAQNGKGRPARGADTAKTTSPPSRTRQLTASSQGSQPIDLLSRMEPRSKSQAAAQVSEVQPAQAQVAAPARSIHADMTLDAIGARSSEILAELRQVRGMAVRLLNQLTMRSQLAQLRRFEASGAVLVPEQKARLAQYATLEAQFRSMAAALASLNDTLQSGIASLAV